MPPDTTLLAYTVSQGLFTGDPQAALDIAVTANTAGPVYCGQILIAIPVGPGGPGVFTAPPTASVSTNTWAPTSAPRRSADPYSTPDTTADYTATIVYDALTGTTQPIGTGLTLGLEGAVNNTFGDTEIQIRETSGTTPDPATFTTKETKVMVRKTPAGFYVRNFIATDPSSPTAPRTDFTKGADIRLQWESNGTNFKITTPSRTIDLGTKTEYTLSGGVSRDTTLILTATSTSSTGSQAVLYDKLTLTIANPDLTPTSVDITSTLDVKGSTTLAAATAAALTATGPVKVGSLSASGTVDAISLTASGATISGDLQAHDLIAESGLTAASAKLTNVTVNGSTGVTGPVSLFGQSEVIYSGTDSGGEVSVTKNTDGIVVMEFMGGDPTRDGASISVYIQVGGKGFALGSPENPRVISVPISAGTQWTYRVALSGFNYSLPPSITWYPLGQNQT
ncbi:hypothetical protein GCM10010387_29280 [Streptomyces inusitatus]|uniref:Uncharacterized protein n=1 Tax=Streptomyces inusitatus TaxID=68221 RepID=A0A918UT72_9ACTN|nr:hypothetical protein [Streptomyces inusitatus]GGZ33288.1 hypothetical protein GCM10010387_29280 [Streptomyces inusitatus]